jgi:hypothetical protein
MKKGLKQQNLAMTASVILLVVVCASFFFLWKSSQPSSSDEVVLEDKYNIVEIASVKQKAEDLIRSKGNLVQMPIKAPTEKIGRVNPFLGI